MSKNIIQLIRVKHWIKNIFVFVPLLYSKNLFNVELLANTLILFAAFCFTVSSVYVFNDIHDADADRKHPTKKNRPLAAKKINIKTAYIISLSFFIVGIVLALFLPIKASITVWIYFLLNILYTLKLKDIVIVDLLTIAFGFILRVLSGAFVIEVEISNWLILTTLFLSVFLAITKRKSELVDTAAEDSRTVLQYYSKKFIDQISIITVAGLIICYSLYTVSERTISVFGTDKLVYSTIFVFYGISRYLLLSNRKQVGEDVVEVLLNDKPMLINIVLYLIFVFITIYYLSPRFL